MQDLTQKLGNIATDGTLSPAQKAHFLALEAENLLPYPSLDEQTRQALDERVFVRLQHLESARLVGGEPFLAADDVQRSAPLRAGLREGQRAARAPALRRARARRRTRTACRARRRVR